MFTAKIQQNWKAAIALLWHRQNTIDMAYLFLILNFSLMQSLSWCSKLTLKLDVKLVLHALLALFAATTYNKGQPFDPVEVKNFKALLLCSFKLIGSIHNKKKKLVQTCSQNSMWWEEIIGKLIVDMRTNLMTKISRIPGHGDI